MAPFPCSSRCSQIAGRLAIQIGAYFLQNQHGGSGVLLGGIPGTLPGPCRRGGRRQNSGAHAVQLAVGMGARVTVLDLDTRKLEAIDMEYRGRSSPSCPTWRISSRASLTPDLLVGAVLIPRPRPRPS